MTTTFILVRHGETDWNREGRYQGKLDIPLNANGRDQAAKLAAGLASLKLDAAYSSHLMRAHETAQTVCAKRGLEVFKEPGFAEINHGDWEGKLAPKLQKSGPKRLMPGATGRTPYSCPTASALLTCKRAP